MSKSLRRLTAEAGKRKATVLWTNQMRDLIGVTYGDKTTTPAGRALKHYASIRISIVRIGSEKEMIDGEKINVCNHVKVDVKKNKTAPPFRVAKFFITYGFGIDMHAAHLDDALKVGVVKKSGGWHSIGTTKIGNGRVNVLTTLREDDELMEDIKTAVETGVIPSKYSLEGLPEKATQSKASQRKRPKAAVEAEEAAEADAAGEAPERVPVTTPQLEAMGGLVDVEDV